MKFKIGKKTHELYQNWNTVKVKHMVQLSKLDYSDEDIKQTIEDENINYDYITDCLDILSTASKDEFQTLTRIELEVLFDIVKHIIVSLFTLEQISYEPKGLRRVKHNGIWYQTPEAVEFEGDYLFAHSEPAKNMTEASNVINSITEMKIKGMDSMPYLCALWLKRIEGEVYDDKKVIARAKTMNDLPGWVAWEVFFCIAICSNKLVNASIFSQAKAAKARKIVTSTLGFSLLLKVKLRGALRKLSRWAFGNFVQSLTNSEKRLTKKKNR